MEIRLRPWGNSTGLRFPKEFLRKAGIKANDSLTADVVDGRIVLTPAFHHRSLAERAADYGGELLLSEEMPREEPTGSEVW